MDGNTNQKPNPQAPKEQSALSAIGNFIFDLVKILVVALVIIVPFRMFVAEPFTGRAGKYVPVAETVRGFKEILEGKHDSKSENDFYMKGAL